MWGERRGRDWMDIRRLGKREGLDRRGEDRKGKVIVLSGGSGKHFDQGIIHMNGFLLLMVPLRPNGGPFLSLVCLCVDAAALEEEESLSISKFSFKANVVSCDG